MISEILTFAGIASLLTVAATAGLLHVCRSNRSAAWMGGLFVPVLGTVLGFYDVFLNLEVDSPPPGMLLIGGLMVLVVLTPVTLIISFATARAYSARGQDNIS